ncbi:related to KRE6 - glucan synthase subunit [Pseudozyma flocculosa]|nr:related to KRE6 - glucan synthase subunit [Pseudozyma flocculosa]
MVQPGAQPLAGNGGQGSGVGPPLSLPGPRATPSNAHSTSSGTTSSRSHLEKQNPGLMIYRSYGDYVVDPEDDDWLHDPKAADRRHRCCGFADTRGCINLLTLSLLAMGLLALFAGYPVISFLERDVLSNKGGFGLGGTNASGQVPLLPINRDLVDPDTPQEARTRMTVDGKKKMVLVFSDEFNQDGRSFYPGDDPFWQAVDLHYWSTGNYEWYSPEAVTTAGGALQITLSEAQTNNLNFRSGMLQTWNQFCFTGGYIEVSMVLPGAPDASGLWPAAWTMGNLGRAGYGATNDGMWPYTYDSCDVGTLKNQTYPTGGPIAAETTGVWVKENGPGVSYLPGQRLSRCTCDGEDHPGPKHPDGSYVGRSAPEIDIIEATASSQAGGKGHASMSAQLAPFDAYYYMKNTTADAVVYDNAAQGQLNSYHGGVYQEAASGIATVKSEAYNETNGQFDTYGFEYKPGSDQDSYITWTLGGDPVWTLHPSAIGPNPQMEIGQRLIPVEPMYIILNLGISSGFTVVQWDRLKFPATMLVDYVRVWQVEGEENVGCDPPDFPTADYIQRHSEAYWNPNLTTWTEPRPRGGYASTFPRNSMLTKCD